MGYKPQKLVDFEGKEVKGKDKTPKQVRVAPASFRLIFYLHVRSLTALNTNTTKCDYLKSSNWNTREFLNIVHNTVKRTCPCACVFRFPCEL